MGAGLFFMITHIFNGIRFKALRQKIRKNPYSGYMNIDGTYNYQEGSYGVKYRVTKLPSGKEAIEWVSERRRIRVHKRGTKGLGNSILKFWRYQGWLVFFRLPILFLLIVSFLLFYLGFLDTQKAKVERFRWIVASVAGVDPNRIQYIGDGWLEISAQRKTAVDKITEPVRYSFNPFAWLFSSHAGYIRRWRGGAYGYATYPVVYNERGDVWINKEGLWQSGKITKQNIEWDVPGGTGIRAGKVAGHELSKPAKELRLKDE